MAVPVVMPQLGESVVEGTITRWHVKPGDTIAKDQILVTVPAAADDALLGPHRGGRAGARDLARDFVRDRDALGRRRARHLVTDRHHAAPEEERTCELEPAAARRRHCGAGP